MQECERLLSPTLRNKHWLRMNETVVRFNLVRAWCCATYRGLQSVGGNKTNLHTLMPALSIHKVYFWVFWFLHNNSTEEGWRTKLREEVEWRASPQMQVGVNWIDDLISQPIKFKSIANCQLGCSSISHTICNVTKQNNSYCAILSLTVHLAGSWCTFAPRQSLKVLQPWIMHSNFITATKQLMGWALAEMNSGIGALARHRCAGCTHLLPVQQQFRWRRRADKEANAKIVGGSKKAASLLCAGFWFADSTGRFFVPEFEFSGREYPRIWKAESTNTDRDGNIR